MNRLIIVFFLGYLSVLSGCDTAENVQPRNEDFFIKVYSGVNRGNQVGNDIIETSGGGLLIAGTSYSEGTAIDQSDSVEYLLIKTDLKGDIEWKVGGHSAGLLKSEAKSLIELPNSTYLLGGTVYDNTVSRSVLLNFDLNGNLIDSAYVFTDTVRNSLSKITYGHSGILVSGETDHVTPGGGGINGFLKLYDLSLNEVGTGTERIRYFGTPGEDRVTGAYEVKDTVNNIGSEGVRFLAFGNTNFVKDGLDNNFYYVGFNKDYLQSVGIGPSTMYEEVGSNEYSISLNGFEDSFWQIGYTDDNADPNIFMVGWEFNEDSESDWGTKLFNPSITAGDPVIGKDVSIQNGTHTVIVCDVQYTIDNSEIYLVKLDRNKDIQEPWPKTYGTNTSSYSASAVTTLQDGSIVVLGTADLEPIKKLIVIKTGPDGQMNF